MDISGNLKAFLFMIAWSEGTVRIPGSNDGYNVLVGATPGRPIFFSSYVTHPDVYNPLLNSTAAGRYQIIHPTWLALTHQTGLTDFSPTTQDQMAAQLIAGRGAMQDVIDGNFARAVQTCAAEWASLPGGDSGQHENRLAELQDAYVDSGGSVA